MTASSTHSKADRLGSFLGLALLVSSAAGGAQPEDNGAAESAARARFAEATKQYNLGQFEQALKEYKEVYELKPHPGLLFNIAQCHRQLADYATAAFYYRRYRDEAHLTGPDSLLVNGLIAEVEAKQAQREAHQRDLEIARAAGKLGADEGRRADGFIGPLPRDENNTIFTKWWFWTAAGVLVTSAAIYYAVPLHPRSASLGEIRVRAAQ